MSDPLSTVVGMELLPVLPLILSIAVIVAIGVLVLFWLLRRACESAFEAAQHQMSPEAVVAALDSAMLRIGAVSDARLDARLRVSNANLEKNLALGQERYDLSTSVIEKQQAEFRSEIKRMEKMVSDFQRQTAGQHGALVSQIQETAKVNAALQQTTGSLRDALGSSKKRGNWGERMAEDILRSAGLKPGINYRTQRGIDSGGRPDFIFLMPQDMVLHMDVKFPADNYLEFIKAERVDASAAEGFAKQFRKDARDRVKELAARRYHEDPNSVDAVVLLIPNESIFSFVQENDPDLMDIAMEAKIVLCGPSTLIAVLQIVRQSMDNFMLEKRSTEILDCLNEFKAEWLKYADQIDKHGRQLRTAVSSFDSLASTRTNVLQRSVDKIDQLQGSAAAGLESLDPNAPALPELSDAS